MSKYERLIDYWEEDSEPELLDEEERILWQGKPKKSAFILNQSIKLFPIAMVWLAFDGFFLVNLFVSGAFFEMIWFIIPFFALHLLPVWLWLKSVMTSGRLWNNTLYQITNQRLVIYSGNFGKSIQSISYSSIKNIELRTGFIDQILHVGDLYFDVTGKKPLALLDLEGAERLYPLLLKIVRNVKKDVPADYNLSSYDFPESSQR